MPAPYVVEEYVRWSDVDFAGIIFYGSYVRFFEIAETELFRAAGLPHREFFDKFDIWLPRKAVHAEFFEPGRPEEFGVHRLAGQPDVELVEELAVGETGGAEQLRFGDLEEADVGTVEDDAREVHVGPADVLLDDVRGGHAPSS